MSHGANVPIMNYSNTQTRAAQHESNEFNVPPGYTLQREIGVTIFWKSQILLKFSDE